MDARGAGLLGQPNDRVFDVLALAHHQVGQLVDDDHQVGQSIGRIGPGLVEAGDVAGGGAGEPAVAVLHLGNGPLERGFGPLRLRDDRHHQMWQAVVGRQLDSLEVHQDQPHLIRRGVAQETRDQRIDHDALARARGAGDEQMRHLGQICRSSVARHVTPEGEGELRGVAEVDLLEDPPQCDDVEVLVRDFQPNYALARDRCLDANCPRCERHGQVVRESLDTGDLDLRRRLDLVLRHYRAGVPDRDPRRDVEARQLGLDDRGIALVIHGAVTVARRDVLEQRERREVILRTRLRRGHGLARSGQAVRGADRVLTADRPSVSDRASGPRGVRDGGGVAQRPAVARGVAGRYLRREGQ